MAQGVIQGSTRFLLPVVALRGLAVFPGAAVSLLIGRPKSISAVNEAVAGEGLLFLVAQRDDQADEPAPDGLFSLGTVVAIKQVSREDEGVVRLSVEGLSRGHALDFQVTEPHLRAVVKPLPEEEGPFGQEVQALVRTVRLRFDQWLGLVRKVREEDVSVTVPDTEGEPGRLADAITACLHVKVEDRQSILDTLPVKERLEKLSRLLYQETELLDLERKIHQRVRHQVEQNQREYFLREQMKAIQRELGEGEGAAGGEGDPLRARMRESGMPEEVAEKAYRELDRLEKMPPQAAEAVVVRNYLDWLVSLPWNRTTEDRLEIGAARQVLEEEHQGLRPVKDRILEFLAVRRLVDNMKGPILCLVGPPGVGKTSLARSVARALGRKYVRVSLGGVRDEAEIRGHRRTYVGALPGRIMQGLRQAGTKNPVFLLDEVDKLAADFRGDPSSALLEVLDPEQNAAFSDHYIEAPFDLSRVLFITTANSIYNIPRPLYDRMEVIFLPGYTEEEKVAIARRYVAPRQMEAHGLKESDLHISEAALRTVVRRYTREAGVRGLERELAAICRKVAVRLAEARGEPSGPTRVTAQNLHRFLGEPRFRFGLAESEHQVGVATGLGWTEYGGDLMAIEVNLMRGKGGLSLTGKLGEVMRESAQAGLSFIRARAASLGVPEDFQDRFDIHIHVPEGAVPKDGPSAGIAMATAVISALAGLPVRRDVAMTGEITLRGRVLPVGGVKEKVLAAHRAGIGTLILPEENRKDIQDVPARVRRQLRFVFVTAMDQVLEEALWRGGVSAESGSAGHSGPLEAAAAAGAGAGRAGQGERVARQGARQGERQGARQEGKRRLR